MTQRHVQFHRLASKEYVDERRWYAKRSTLAASRFESAVDAAVARIEEDPIQFPVFRDENRWIRLKRFPHVLYFLVLNDTTVEILAVAHGMRRPSYWIRRTKRR